MANVSLMPVATLSSFISDTNDDNHSFITGDFPDETRFSPEVLKTHFIDTLLDLIIKWKLISQLLSILLHQIVCRKNRLYHQRYITKGNLIMSLPCLKTYKSHFLLTKEGNTSLVECIRLFTIQF